METKKSYLDVKDVSNILGVSNSKAYVIIRTLNNTLKEKGYLTICGKIPTSYFNEKWYGGTRD